MICTPAEVATHAGHGTLSTADEAAVAAQIVLYQGELEGILGRGVERTTRTETRPVDYASDRFDARFGPVHAITSVTVGGVPLTSNQYARSRYGMELWGWYYTTTTADLVVVYEGGFGAPENLPAKNAVIARTARWLNKRTDDDVGTDGSTVEGHTVKWMADEFTEAELRACERLRAPDMAA